MSTSRRVPVTREWTVHYSLPALIPRPHFRFHKRARKRTLLRNFLRAIHFEQIVSESFGHSVVNTTHLALLPLDLGEMAIKIVKVRHISPDGGYIASNLLDRRRQLRLPVARDEDVSAFAHKQSGRRQADAAAATRY